MKNTASKPSDRTLLVLGAGASIGAAKYPIENSVREAMGRMPSGENFFYDMFFQPKTTYHDAHYMNVLGLTDKGLNDFIIKAWAMKKNRKNFDIDEWRQLNIEEVFTFLDIGDKMYPRGSYYQKGFSTLKRHLKSFITFMLAYKSDGFHCEHLMDILFKLKPTSSIISFNWDTIADFTLQCVADARYSSYVDLMTAAPLRVADFIGRGVLLKLHGSLNWIVCSNSQCSSRHQIRLACQERKLMRLREAHKCPMCGDDRGEPFIVPPTSQKLIHRDSMLHKLWTLARAQLPYFRRIIFIGYSFPTTDFYSEWLFRQIHFVEANRPEIIVVNPAITKKPSAIAERYGKIFKDCKIRKFSTLEQFRHEGNDFLH
jgi:hypothetical protein